MEVLAYGPTYKPPMAWSAIAHGSTGIPGGIPPQQNLMDSLGKSVWYVGDYAAVRPLITGGINCFYRVDVRFYDDPLVALTPNSTFDYKKSWYQEFGMYIADVIPVMGPYMTITVTVLSVLGIASDCSWSLTGMESYISPMNLLGTDGTYFAISGAAQPNGTNFQFPDRTGVWAPGTYTFEFELASVANGLNVTVEQLFFDTGQWVRVFFLGNSAGSTINAVVNLRAAPMRVSIFNGSGVSQTVQYLMIPITT